MTPYVMPEMRWHVPAEDCPNRAAFLDRLLLRRRIMNTPDDEPLELVAEQWAILASQHPPVKPAPEPEQPRCKACGKVIQENVNSRKARRFDVQFCDQVCRKRHAYAVRGGKSGGRATQQRHSGQCRKCGTSRHAGETCPKCRAETKRKSNAKQRAKTLPAIPPSDAEAVGVRA